MKGLLADQQAGLNIDQAKVSVAQFLDHWLTEVVQTSVKPKTRRTYADLIRLHIKPGIGSLPLAKLSMRDVRLLINDKLTTPQAPRRRLASSVPANIPKPLSSRTVKHILATLRAALNYAKLSGLVRTNVASLVAPPPVRKREMRVFSRDHARAFLTAIQGHRWEALFVTAIALGYRQGEALGLQESDVDLQAATLTIRHSLQRIDGKLQLFPTKEDKIHTVMLPDVTVSALTAHRKKKEEVRVRAGSSWQTTAFEFTTSIGTPIDARSIVRSFDSILKRAGLPKIRFHDLRHSAATLLLAQGVSPRYICDLLGHSQVSFTMQTYAHVIETVQRDVARHMDHILDSNVATKIATKAKGRGQRGQITS